MEKTALLHFNIWSKEIGSESKGGRWNKVYVVVAVFFCLSGCVFLFVMLYY